MFASRTDNSSDPSDAYSQTVAFFCPFDSQLSIFTPPPKTTTVQLQPIMSTNKKDLFDSPTTTMLEKLDLLPETKRLDIPLESSSEAASRERQELRDHNKRVTAALKRNPKARVSGLKEWRDETDVALFRNPNDVDALAKRKAMQAAMDLARARSLPKEWGKGWGVNPVVVLEAYEAAKKAVPMFDPGKGELGAWLYTKARSSILDAARKAFKALGASSAHVQFAESILEHHGAACDTDSGNYVTPPLSDDRNRDYARQVLLTDTHASWMSQADSELLIERFAKRARLSSMELEIVTKYHAGASSTKLAAEYGCSESAMETRLRRILEKLKQAAKAE